MVRVNNNSTTTSPASALSPEAALSPISVHHLEEDVDMEDSFQEEVKNISGININDHEEPSVSSLDVSSNSAHLLPSGSEGVNHGETMIDTAMADSNYGETIVAPNGNNQNDQKDQGQYLTATISRKDKNINNADHIIDPVTSKKTTQELIREFEIRIMRLRIEQMDKRSAKEAAEINELIAQFTISINNLKGNNSKINNANQHHSNDTKKFVVPVFQLVDDPANTKSEGKPSYDNAETFITTFENVLSANDIDIKKDWNKYLLNAFIFSRNEKYVKFYNNQLGSKKGKEKDWDEIKNKIIDRFGTSNNIANNINSFIQIHQGKVELIRDYMDRYIDIYNKIPENSKTDTQIDAGKFIHSLVPDVMQEVIKFLKRNKAKDRNTYLPDSLTALFNVIEENIGEIQEALYITTKTPNHGTQNSHQKSTTSKRDRAPSPVEQDNSYKKVKMDNNQHVNNNRKINICTYCKEKPFTYRHLDSCVPYLHSNKYKERLLQKQSRMPQTVQNKVIPIYFSNSNDSKTDYNLDIFSETYENIEKEIKSVFKKLEKKLEFDPIKYHNQFVIQSKNAKHINKNEKNLFENKNNDPINCYLVEGYSEKENQKLSPYSPFIIVNKEKLVSMLDTGSNISLINKTYDFEDKSIFDNYIPTLGKLSFVSKDQQSARIGKTKPLEVVYRGRMPFLHSFEIVEMKDNKIPLLIGRDISHKLGIRVENIAHTFDDIEQIEYDDTVDNETYIPNVTLACSKEEYDEFMKYMKPFIKKNQDINVHELCPLKEAKVYLKTKPDEYAFARQYPIAYSLQGVVRDQIKKWLDDRTIEFAAPSGFNSPLTLVPKPSGKDGTKKWRVCLDTRRINNLLENVSNVNTPLIEDIFHSVRDSAVYSVFDITGAFHRLEINKEDRHKLTFTFEGQSYQFRGSPFGIKSLSGIFQNVMQTIFADMQDFTCIYIDDLICHSKDMESHKKHCQLVIEALTKYKLPLNMEKTYLARNSVYLLGFQISKEGKSIDVRRLTNIDEWVKPTTPKAMMKFCGLISYLRAHLPKASELTAPLDHLRYSTKKTLEWTPEMHQSYDSIIQIIKSNIKLSHPDLDHEFSLACDASNYAVSCCLFQEFVDAETKKKTIKYIGFASKALTKSQRSYSTTKKELYALITGLNKFHKFLYGSKPFRCYTDHRSLQYLQNSKHTSMMMLRYLEIILTFPNMKIIWIPGIQNVLSDKLSRVFPTDQDNISFEKDEKALFPHLFAKSNKNKKRSVKKTNNKRKATNQTSDKTISNELHKAHSLKEMPDFNAFFCETNDKNHNFVRLTKRSIKTVHDLLDDQLEKEQEKLSNEEHQIYYAQNMDESYIIPPEADRKDILINAHEFGHYGGEAIVQRIRKDEGMNWPNIIKDALEVVKQCSACQKFMIAKRGYNPLKPIYCYTSGWQYSVDLCGPFPVTSSKNTYILVLIDIATRFIVLRAITDKSAKTVARALINIFSLIGYPRSLCSDQGGEWRNQILDSLCEAMKIDKRLSTPYWAPGNGSAEISVRKTKTLLAKLIQGVSEDDWDIVLDSVQLMINCKIHKRINTSPFNLMFARKMTNELPLFAHPDDKNIEPMSHEELLKRIEYMSDIVFPAIKERTEVYNKMMKNSFDKRHRLINFPVGSFVVVKNKGILKSLAPPFAGPYEVVRKTEAGNYTLRDEMGLLMSRDYTPSELQIVSNDAVVSKEEVYEFDAIVTHRGEPGNREYLIRWKNYSPEHDSWIPLKNFTDPQAVVKYWKRVKGSVPEEENEVLEKMFVANTSDLPDFDINKKGKLLSQIDEDEEELEDERPSPSKTDSPRRVYKKQIHRTKPIGKNPVSSSFRRSPRSNKPTVTIAHDKTRYKK